MFTAAPQSHIYNRAAGALEVFTAAPQSLAYKQTSSSPYSSDADLRLTRKLLYIMGYACPVCETPQRDGEHLAHHLAFTAMLHGDDHEAWLDDRVPDWNDRDPDGLATAVTPHAEDAEYHEVFEDTVDRGRPDVDLGDHDHAGGGGTGHGHAHGAPEAHGARGVVDQSGATDPETEAALREARELTRKMFEDGEGDDTDDTEGGDPDSDPDSNADPSA